MTNDIKQIIEAVVRERLGDTEILKVEVEDDIDHEGDGIYRVLVVYDHESGIVDANRAAGLTRHARSKLSERNIFSFPIFRFVSQSDARKLKSAAA